MNIWILQYFDGINNLVPLILQPLAFTNELAALQTASTMGKRRGTDKIVWVGAEPEYKEQFYTKQMKIGTCRDGSVFIVYSTSLNRQPRLDLDLTTL